MNFTKEEFKLIYHCCRLAHDMIFKLLNDELDEPEERPDGVDESAFYCGLTLERIIIPKLENLMEDK